MKQEIDSRGGSICVMLHVCFILSEYRRKQVHRKTIAMFPGNNIPIFRGNPSAKKRLEDLSNKCQDQLNPDIGYDEGKSSNCVYAVEFTVQPVKKIQK